MAEKEDRILRTFNDGSPIITYIGECCREWVLALGVPVGRCGLCGEKPVFLRSDSE